MLIIFTTNIHGRSKHSQGQKQPASSQSYSFSYCLPLPCPQKAGTKRKGAFLGNGLQSLRILNLKQSCNSFIFSPFHLARNPEPRCPIFSYSLSLPWLGPEERFPGASPFPTSGFSSLSHTASISPGYSMTAGISGLWEEGGASRETVGHKGDRKSLGKSGSERSVKI